MRFTSLICPPLFALYLPTTAYSAPQCGSPRISVVHEFPEATWVENLAVRSNGQIIATEDTKPRLHLIDPSSPGTSQVLHQFSDTASLLGISEGAEDVFYVSTGNFSSLLLEGYGQAFVYEIDLRSFRMNQTDTVGVSKIAEINDAGALNGLVTLPGGQFLLVADFLRGLIWKVDILTGESTIAVQNDFTNSTGFGVNGLKYVNGLLYFTNSQKGTLARVPVDENGEVWGEFEVVLQGEFTPDDFALDFHGDAYITTFTSPLVNATSGKDGVLQWSKDDCLTKYIADIAGPTACVFGRLPGDDHTLYVSTTGGDNNYLTGEPIDVSGKIIKVAFQD